MARSPYDPENQYINTRPRLSFKTCVNRIMTSVEAKLKLNEIISGSRPFPYRKIMSDMVDGLIIDTLGDYFVEL